MSSAGLRIDSENLNRRFARDVQSLHQLLEKTFGGFGMPIDRAFPIFRTLDLTGKQRALQLIERTLGVCEIALDNGDSLADSGALTWRALNAMGYQFQKDAFLEYRHGDFIDVYNAHHQLIFASLNFFRVSHYSIEQLYCIPWMSLWERDETIAAQIYGLAEDIVAGRVDKTITYPVQPHVIRESATASNRSSETTLKALSPIYRSGEPGYLCINRLT